MATSPSQTTRPQLSTDVLSGLQSATGYKIDILETSGLVQIVVGNTLPTVDGYYIFPTSYTGPLPLGVALNDVTVRANAGATFGLYQVYANCPFSIRTTTNEVYQKSLTSIAWVYQGTGHHGVLDVANQSVTGSINIGVANIDDYSLFNVNQTTSGIEVTLPSPTLLTANRVITVNNIGSLALIVNTVSIAANSAVNYLWDGDSWVPAGGSGSGSSVLNYNLTTAYTAGQQAIRRGVVIQTNAAVPASTVFNWGTAGATWKPVLDPVYTWGGVWSNATTYVGNEVVVTSTTSNQLYRCTVGHLNIDPSTSGSGENWEDFLSVDIDSFKGATLTKAGNKGLVPFSVAGNTDGILHGDNTWTGARLKNTDISDLAIGGDITNGVSTIQPSIIDRYIVTQTTAGQVVTVPTPSRVGTPNYAGRVIWVMSAAASTASFDLYGKTVGPGDVVELFWDESTWLVINVSHKNEIQFVSSDTTLTTWGLTVYASTGLTLTLPTAVGHAGERITVKRAGVSTGVVGFLNFGAETLDGTSASNGISLVYGQAVTFESDGTNVYTVSRLVDEGAAVSVGNSAPDPFHTRKIQMIASGAGPHSVANPALYSSAPTLFTTQLKNSAVVPASFVFANTWKAKDGQDFGTITLAVGEYRHIEWQSDVNASTLRVVIDSKDNGQPAIQDWVALSTVRQGELRKITSQGVAVYISSSSERTTTATLDAAELANWTYVSQGAIGSFTVSEAIVEKTKILVSSLLYERTASGTTTASFDDTEKASWRILNPPRVEIRTITADYTAQEWDEVILVDTTAGNVTVTIPVTLSTGKKVVVHKTVSANSMIVASTALVKTNFTLGTTESFNGIYSNIPYYVANNTVRVYS